MIYIGTIAMCVALMPLAEAAYRFIENGLICKNKVKSMNSIETCSQCCKREDYTRGIEDRLRRCTCKKSGETRKKMGDIVLQSGGLFGRDVTYLTNAL